MDDLELYEWWAAEALTIAKTQGPRRRDAYEELASELLSLANLAIRVAA